MKLQEQILEELSDKMHSAIDFEILADVLVKNCDWHRIDLDRFTDNHHAIDITYWLQENCQGRYHREGRHFIFEQTKDALLFTLKWL